jgi:hypothetical protein
LNGLRNILFAAVLTTLAGTAPGLAAGPPPPDLMGIWSGDGPTRLTITKQLGTALDGLLFADGHERPIYGVIQRDRKEIMFINPEGDRRAELLEPDAMEFCLAARDDFVFDGPCVLLRRTIAQAKPPGGG